MRLPVTEDYLAVLLECRAQIPNCTFMTAGNLHPAVQTAIGNVSDGSNSLISRAGNLPDRAIPNKHGALKCSACGHRINHNVLLSNGNVALCCMVYDLKHVLGNLLKQSYEDLFASSEYNRVLNGLAGDESIDIACRKCEISAPI